MQKKSARRVTSGRKTSSSHAPTGVLLKHYSYVCKLAAKLPGVEMSTSYGTPSIKVKGKIMARLRSEAEGALALRCDFIDREILLQADPEAFFLTDHYLNYPMILIRLDRVRRDALPDLLERAWTLVAPAKLIRERQATRGSER
jgi:hypothetical protein